MNNSVYSVQTIENWTSGQTITLTLNEDLPEKCSATTWLTESGFFPENIGRSKFIHLAGKYKIDMSGKRGNGSVDVRIPFENIAFTVSV